MSEEIPMAVQLSETVGSTQVAIALQPPTSARTVMSSGTPTATGISESWTETVKELVASLPWISVAV